MKYRLVSIYLLVLIFISCRKDKLKDEKSILEGKWKWIFTNEGINDPNYWANKTPATEGKTYSVEFLKCGKIKFYENGNVVDEKRIVFGQFNACDPAYGLCWSFSIYLNKKSEDILAGGIYDKANDTLKLREYGYPFSGDYIDGGIWKEHINYFVREN